MTGAEHYKLAESILAEAGDLAESILAEAGDPESGIRPESVVSLLRFAQVHATLAQAAAALDLAETLP